MVSCAVCNKRFRSITNSHLKTHRISMEEYRKEFSDWAITSDDTKRKLKENAKDCTNCGFQQGHKINQGKRPWNMGETKETNDKVYGLSMKLRGRIISQQTRQNLSNAALEGYRTGKRVRRFGSLNPQYGKKLSEAHKHALLSSIRGMHKTKPEKFIERILCYFDDWEYTGDRKLWVTFLSGRRKNPDFTHKHLPLVVEVFGRYWHRAEEEDEIINEYALIGYKCLVIWDNALFSFTSKFEHFLGIDEDVTPLKVEQFISLCEGLYVD